MIEVVKPPRTFQSICTGCTAVIGYTGDEVKTIRTGSSRYGDTFIRGIVCPICSTRIQFTNPPERD